jgi:hypothetical protein
MEEQRIGEMLTGQPQEVVAMQGRVIEERQKDVTF